VTKAVGGGNLLLLARDTDAALGRCDHGRRAGDAHGARRDPAFPGGVVRSGSKVGSKYAA
jgi:formylmethanofuran--tetrahydromethanopterin N-formyltransferase